MTTNPHVDKYGDKRWYNGYRLHRTDGPAVEWKGGDKTWWFDGQKHRYDGPAVEYTSGYKEWWIFSIQYSKEQFETAISNLEKVMLTESVVDTDGKNIWHHIDAGGREYYFTDDRKYHRLGGPAFIDPKNKYKEFRVNGQLHREDGPAIVKKKYHGDYEEYWVNGVKQGKKDKCKSIPLGYEDGKFMSDERNPPTEAEIAAAVVGCLGIIILFVSIFVASMRESHNRNQHKRESQEINNRYEASYEKDKHEKNITHEIAIVPEQSLIDDLNKYITIKNQELAKLGEARSKVAQIISQFSEEGLLISARQMMAEIDSKIDLNSRLRNKAAALINDAEGYKQIEEIRKWLKEN